MKKGQVQCPLDGPLVAADVQRMSVGLVLQFCVGHVSLKLVLAQLPPFLTAFQAHTAVPCQQGPGGLQAFCKP